MKKEEKYRLFVATLKDKIGNYLSKRNYNFKGIEIIPSMGTTEWLCVRFENEIIKYDITFNYWIKSFNGDISEDISISIYNLSHYSISVYEIFKYDDIQYQNDKFCLLNYSATFEQQVEQFCEYVISLFDNHLQRWITGEKWADIPFDWGPYK